MKILIALLILGSSVTAFAESSDISSQQKSFICSFLVGNEEIARDTISADSVGQAIFLITVKDIEIDGRNLPTVKGFASKTPAYSPAISDVQCK